MNLADVNVLVHALRGDSANHSRCRTWLEREIASEGRFGVAPQVLAGVVRVVTHPRIYATPTPPSLALGFCDAILAAPGAVRLEPGPQHWETFRRLVSETRTQGNLVPDAWFAALAIEHGCTWVTLDRDFSIFRGLRLAAP